MRDSSGALPGPSNGVVGLTGARTHFYAVYMPERGAPRRGRELTRLLRAWSDGDPRAAEELMPLVYREMRRRAAAQLRSERDNHTLRPTEVVHEAYLRLCAQNNQWENREQFFAIAGRMMRRVLVDHARARAASKRDRNVTVALADGHAAVPPPTVDVLALDEALEELAAIDPRQVQLVELRFFGGFTLEESARLLGISRATADRDWALARAWLYRRLEGAAGA